MRRKLLVRKQKPPFVRNIKKKQKLKLRKLRQKLKMQKLLLKMQRRRLLRNQKMLKLLSQKLTQQLRLRLQRQK